MNSPNDELREQIEMGKALEALERDPNFILVIRRGYIDYTLINESQGTIDINQTVRQESLEKIQSVSYLKRRLTEIKNMADGALADFEQEG